MYPFLIYFISYGKRDALYLRNRRENCLVSLGCEGGRRGKGTGVCLNTGIKVKAYLKSVRKEITPFLGLLNGRFTKSVTDFGSLQLWQAARMLNSQKCL